VINENLRFMFQTPERVGVNDPVSIPLKWRAVFSLWLTDAPSPALAVFSGVGGQLHGGAILRIAAPLIEAAGTSIY
jgi:hypothetical protein